MSSRGVRLGPGEHSPGCLWPLGGATLSLRGQETPAEHTRTALMLLDDLERELRGLGFILTAEQALSLYGPLAAARGRLWQAITTLEGSTS